LFTVPLVLEGQVLIGADDRFAADERDDCWHFRPRTNDYGRSAVGQQDAWSNAVR
jgi:hypothetical protein